MKNNNIPNIPAEKFRFVSANMKLHDQKFETKQVSYFRDAFHRCCKNKSSVVAAIIILVLVLYAVFVPVFCNNNYTRALTDTTYLQYTKLLPKIGFLHKAGINFWDGSNDQTISEANYIALGAITQETGHEVFRKVYGTNTDEKGKLT